MCGRYGWIVEYQKNLNKRGPLSQVMALKLPFSPLVIEFGFTLQLQALAFKRNFFFRKKVYVSMKGYLLCTLQGFFI